MALVFTRVVGLGCERALLQLRPLARGSVRALSGLASASPPPTRFYPAILQARLHTPPLPLGARGLAKAKGKGKGKAAAKAKAAGAEEEEEEEEDSSAADDGPELDMDDLRKRMDGALEHFRKELVPLRLGRAQPGMLDHVVVPLPEGGGNAPLVVVGRVVVRDPQKLEVTVFDPALASAVAKAIGAAGLELNPSFERNVVHVPLPRITSEQRHALVKTVHTLAEKSKTALRKVRQAALKQVKALKGMPKDELSRLEKQVQELTDSATKQLTEIAASKEKGLLEG
jgi:ribosome recycling factor